MSDLARILMLHAHGGWYLDLDVIVLRSLAGLTNGVGCLQWGNHRGRCSQVPNGIMIFDKGHDYLESCFKDLLNR
jgi:mannosyltransferase OCH1-like enzyme